MKGILGKSAIIVILAIILMNIVSINYIVHADDGVNWESAKEFINKGKTSTAGGINDLTDIGNSFSSIGNVLRYIGAGILVAAMAYMGILYMVSPPEKQAKLKQQLIGLVISAIVIFGAYFIWQIIVELLESVVG